MPRRGSRRTASDRFDAGRYVTGHFDHGQYERSSTGTLQCVARLDDDMASSESAIVTLRARMKMFLPRWALSVDPHVQVDDSVVKRLEREPAQLELQLDPGVHVIAVVPSARAVGDLDRRLRQSGLWRTEIGRRVEVFPGPVWLDLVFRPFPLQASMTRGFLRISPPPVGASE